MSVTSISELSRQHMLNILGYGSANQSASTTGGNTSSGGTLSPFAQMLSQLQQLEQSNPSQYARVSQQISTNLSGAAANAQAQGNSPLASKLTNLSKDFANASQTGQLPNVDHLASAMSANGSAAAVPASPASTGATAGPVPHHSFLNAIGRILGLAAGI